MMIGKLLKKLFGKEVGTVADVIVDSALDKATGGVSTMAEEAVRDIRAQERRRKAKRTQE